MNKEEREKLFPIKDFPIVVGADFMANGKHYFVEERLSAARYAYFERLESEFGFGRTFPEIITEVTGTIQLLNNTQWVPAAVKLTNLQNGISQIDSKKPHAFRYCALFINEENEDPAIINEDLINRKINDWQVEGLEYRPFLAFVISSLPAFRDVYQQLFLSGSEKI